MCQCSPPSAFPFWSCWCSAHVAFLFLLLLLLSYRFCTCWTCSFSIWYTCLITSCYYSWSFCTSCCIFSCRPAPADFPPTPAAFTALPPHSSWGHKSDSQWYIMKLVMLRLCLSQSLFIKNNSVSPCHDPSARHRVLFALFNLYRFVLNWKAFIGRHAWLI